MLSIQEMENSIGKHFEKLDFATKLSIIKRGGKLIARRQSEVSTISLFEIFGFYVEVFFEPGTNHITSIELLPKNQIIKYYTLRVK